MLLLFVRLEGVFVASSSLEFETGDIEIRFRSESHGVESGQVRCAPYAGLWIWYYSGSGVCFCFGDDFHHLGAQEVCLLGMAYAHCADRSIDISMKFKHLRCSRLPDGPLSQVW